MRLRTLGPAAALLALSACSSAGGQAGADAAAEASALPLDAAPAVDAAAPDSGMGAVDAGRPDAAATDAGNASDAASTLAPCPQPLKASGPVQIDGQNGTVLEGLKITSTSGDCVTVTGSQNVTIRSSEIGPCGGNGINVSGSTNVTITDNYVHPEVAATGCCDSADGVLVGGSSSKILIQGNVIVYGESNIELPTTTSEVHVIGNFLLNPRGPSPRGQQVQAWHVTDIWVENNYGLSSLSPTYAFPEHQEDAFNFGFTAGTVVASDNYITGGHSASGCGLIADDSAGGCTFQGNSLLDTGQCGIGIASGASNVVDDNRVLNTTPVDGGGNTGIYVWNQYPGACGPTQVTNNVACQLKPDGTQSGYWNGGGCDPVTETGNVWDTQAQAILTPPSQKMPPPAIPPQPYACVAPSPF